VLEGSVSQMVCHLVETQNMLGRSTVIDLNAKTENKFKQVDHRTIDWLIIKNVKYVLKKSGVKSVDNEEMKEECKEPKWDNKKLVVGNWFSGARYF